LEEVVVTATRREESVEKVPISINAISQTELTEAGIKGISDIAAVTPGLQLTTPSGFSSTLTAISIRGMNTDAGASTVGLYLDDTPIQVRLTTVGGTGNPFPAVFDLDRVEVARGPQGTLFGAGAEAGTVRFITNQPSLTDFSGFSHAELATTQDGGPSFELGAAAGGPIVADEVGFRVSAWSRRDGGFVDRIDPVTGDIVKRDANTDATYALRAALTLAPDKVKITPSVDYQSVSVNDGSRFYGYYSDPSAGYFVDGKLLPETSRDRLFLPSVKIESELSFADLVSTTSYLHRDNQTRLDASTLIGAIIGGYGNPLGPGYPTSGADAAPDYQGQRVVGLTEEVRLASNKDDGSFTWVAGAFYDHRTEQDYQLMYSLPVDSTGAPILNYNQHITDEQLAIYGQVDFHITRQWTVTLGERIARVMSDLNEVVGPGVLDVGVPSLGVATLSQTPSTPRVSLSYQADQNNMMYVSASRGFRVGGGNAPLGSYCDVTAPTSYKSDYVWSYEVGAKDKLFNERVQINSSVFHLDWSQIQQVIPLSCGETYITNTGRAVSDGFDLDLQALITDRLRFNAGIGYVNAYFNSNVSSPLGPLVLAGDKIGLLPQVYAPWNLNLVATYEIPLSWGDTIHLRGSYQHNSRNPGPFTTQTPTSPSYYPLLVADPPTDLTNCRVIYTRGKLDISMFLNNAFNAHPLLGKYQDTATSNLITYTTFRPRTVGLSGDLKF
jgi:outer membrane receptor protein involved in Fe transport